MTPPAPFTGSAITAATFGALLKDQRLNRLRRLDPRSPLPGQR